MEISRRKEGVEDTTCDGSNNFYNLNEAVKEESSCDNLWDVGCIKIEERDLEELYEESIKIEKIEKSITKIKEIYFCNSCNFKCYGKPNLIAHVKTHLRKRFRCRICKFTSLYKCSLKKHRLVHTGEKPFKCNVCDYAFSQKVHLRTHFLKHTGEQPFKCSVCIRTCSTRAELKKHIFVHTTEKPFKCTLCDFECLRKSDLNRHALVHSGAKPLKCSLCDYTCSRKDVLKNHFLLHADKKVFKCDICNYSSYCTSFDLNRHLSIHTKPYKCTVCDYSCSRKGDLKSHLLKHTRKKSFNCSRKRHFKHTGEKPFKCFECDHTCWQKMYLTKHLLVHTAKKTDLKKQLSADPKLYKCSI